MIYVGIDDTDTLDTRGTNQLARALAALVREQYACQRITRHQLLSDPRVPYTSKNGSASLVFEPMREPNFPWLLETLTEAMRADFIPGSDPGLCISQEVAPAVRDFGKRCQTELIPQREARTLAANEGVILHGLGGTEDGVIGALAAIGLAAANNDGRIIQLADWPDDLTGVQPLEAITVRGVAVHDLDANKPIDDGLIDLGKKLRPNWRHGHPVLYVQQIAGAALSGPNQYQAIRLP